ncbi:MAG: SDR family oxidoreductase [Alphaproteobacteria bacterium]|nr:SDR family oxidoreductase [Alphaproteobacteria bacterium]
MRNSGDMNGILFFGFGFCATHLAPLLAAEGFALKATCRDDEKAALLEAQGVTPIMLDGAPLQTDALAGIDHILLSAAPNETGDPALPLLQDALALSAARMKWLGYLSTTGVYGDHAGAWIDEETPRGKVGARGRRRVDAEAAWRALADALDLPLHYFRLAGIYGPGRNQLASLKRGAARRIEKPDQVFSRIHVADIAQILRASMAQPNAGRAYSVCDDEAAPPQDVVTYAAQLMGVEPPPLIPFEAADLSPMAQSFYADNKRIKNDRIKQELGVTLAYPTYREGLKALYDAAEF